ncbi:hypothetical protein SDC9_202023 [bioreactor metagenome]|uniref:Uncharacterized protein n=1 Tax=bioreactor metagenome TaxID=1076179 RepID=A0A645J4E5_9ZZZZ
MIEKKKILDAVVIVDVVVILVVAVNINFFIITIIPLAVLKSQSFMKK